jgi:prepilin-type N-terminal cleavage/methylation domain-containing protein
MSKGIHSTVHPATGGLSRAAFTLIELLVVVTIIVVLLALLTPALDKAIDAAERAACMANYHGIYTAVRLYTLSEKKAFMSHRTNEAPQGAEEGPQMQEGAKEKWWATLLFPHGAAPKLFQCPSLGGSQMDFGRTWQWDFDQHNVGYGYNGWFLGIYPYNPPDVPWSMNARTSQVRVPSQNILIGESHPRPDNGAWSQSIWWGNSSAAPENNAGNEGISRNRHTIGSQVLFNDGHSDLFFYDESAPQGERDPINPNHVQVFEDMNSVRYWDPLQRSELGPGT